MGVPFAHPAPDHVRSISESDIDWLERAQPEQVSITLDAGCLCRLLSNHQLHVQDFSCVDEPSQACVRRLLLALISNSR